MPTKKDLPPPFPEREELKTQPQTPRMIMEISRLLRFRIRREEDGGVMSGSTARLVLSHLAMRDGINQLELVNLTRLKPPTVSVLLRRMEQEGYLCRTQDPADRRAVRVSLTEKGREFDRRRLSGIITNDQVAMQGIGADEEAVLMGLLTKIRDNLLEKEGE